MASSKWFNSEEGTVLLWALVASQVGVLCWLLAHAPHEPELLELASTILIGAGSGALAATVAQAIERKVRERAKTAYFGNYAGKWKRVLMYQYRFMRKDGTLHDQERITNAEGLTSEVVYEGGTRISLKVRYDDSRGEATAAIYFPGLEAHIGAGVYFYTEGKLASAEILLGLAHHGRYTMHLNPKESDLIILFHDGLIPDPNARGYEVWQRV